MLCYMLSITIFQFLLLETTDSFDYEGFTYFISNEVNSAFTLTHEAASEFCRTTGRGMLASVTSQAETDTIIKEINNRGTAYFWISLEPTSLPVTGCRQSCGRCPSSSPVNNNDCLLCGQCRQRWKWSDGSLYDWTYWQSQQPNDNVRCVAINKGTGQWYDQQCTTEHSFICKTVNCAEQCRATSDCEIQVLSTKCKCSQCHSPTESTTENSTLVPTIVLGVLLMVSLVTIVILIFILCRYRRKMRYNKEAPHDYYNCHQVGDQVTDQIPAVMKSSNGDTAAYDDVTSTGPIVNDTETADHAHINVSSTYAELDGSQIVGTPTGNTYTHLSREQESSHDGGESHSNGGHDHQTAQSDNNDHDYEYTQ